MKEFIKRWLIISITAALIIYIGFLFIQWKVIVSSEYLQQNTIYYIVLLVVLAYIMIFHGIRPVYVRFSKPMLFFIGIWLIIISRIVFQNNGEEWIYIGDITSVIWVVLTLLSRTKALTSEKILKKKAEDKIKVIEV